MHCAPAGRRPRPCSSSSGADAPSTSTRRSGNLRRPCRLHRPTGPECDLTDSAACYGCERNTNPPSRDRTTCRLFSVSNPGFLVIAATRAQGICTPTGTETNGPCSPTSGSWASRRLRLSTPPSSNRSRENHWSSASHPCCRVSDYEHPANIPARRSTAKMQVRGSPRACFHPIATSSFGFF